MDVTEAVFEILGTDNDKDQTKPATKAAKRASIVSELELVVQAKLSWDDVERLVLELTELEGK